MTMTGHDSSSSTPQRMSLFEEAQQRADSARKQSSQSERTVLMSPHPLAPMTPQASSSSPPLTLSSPAAVLAQQARQEWQRHGSGVSQVAEEKKHRNGVRVISAESRVDASGTLFTAYVISASGQIIEHRYGDFAKLHALLRKHSVPISTAFPAKHWAGRMGNWTPSLTWAPAQHDDLVAFRKVQLDLWLADVVHLYNTHTLLPDEVKTAIHDFLHVPHRPPCQDPNDGPSSLLSWSNPMSFTLGSALRQATATVQHMMIAGSTGIDSDQSIPLDLLHHAKGLCFLTVAKAGLVVSGKVGTGLVIARRGVSSGGNQSLQQQWSAPSALGTVGVGWGAQVGGDITHYLVVLTSQKAVESLCQDQSVNLGAELGVAVGPLGRGARVSSSGIMTPAAYAYAHSHGFFVGMSLEGSVLTTRHDVNAKFYGSQVSQRELLLGTKVAPPRAAEPLYEALEQAWKVDIPTEGFRPSQLWKGHDNSRRAPSMRNESISCATDNVHYSGQSPLSSAASLMDTTFPQS